MIGSNARERSPVMTELPTEFTGALKDMYGPLAERAIDLYATPNVSQNRPDPLYGSSVEQTDN
jgi:hypothetical protein